MTKRVYRYFFDFMDGQEKWLNEMAAKGWRLTKCGQLTYDFESCTPDEYEYAVEFVAEQTYTKAKDYKAFLESVGYKAFYKNLNVGIVIGAVKWRPWGDGAGQFTTAPGSYQKELLIVEKKKDGKAFALHTDLTDTITKHQKIFSAYLWFMFGAFSLAAMFLAFSVWQLFDSSYVGAAAFCLSAIPCAVLGFLWLKPTIKISHKIGELKQEAKIREYDAPSMRKTVLKMIAVAAIPVVIVSLVFGILYIADVPFDSYSARNMSQTSWGSHWNASYKELSGYTQRRATLEEGKYTFTIEIITNSGTADLSITGQDGKEYYIGTNLATSTFDVQVDIAAKDRLTLRIDAKKHSGGYRIKWD